MNESITRRLVAGPGTQSSAACFATMTDKFCPGGAHVLVVEDEPFIRTSTVEALEELGCKTLEAENADEALVRLREHPRVDILFADINMPGLVDGLELARQVKQKWPHISLIITSGRALPDKSALPDGALFIQKPYFQEDLEQIAKQAGC